MAQFIYQARSQHGNLTRGVIEAHNESEAVSILHENSLTILSLEPKSKGVFLEDIGALIARPTRKDVVFFARQLATLIDADVPLVNALNTLAEQAINPPFKKILTEVSEMVDAGSSLSSSLNKYPKVFSKFFVSLVKSGETSGKLHDVFNHLADYLEKQAEIRSRIMGALIYPAVLLVAVIGIFIILFFGFPLLDLPPIIPQILLIVEESGIEDLPLATRTLIFANKLLTNYWYIWLAVVLGIGSWLSRYIKSPRGREFYDKLKLQLPFLKKATRGIYLARFSETLSTLVKVGVPILDSLDIASDVVGNKVYQDIIREVRDEVGRGMKISEVFARHSDFIPPIIVQMLVIGEKTGKLDFILEHISKFYSNEADAIIKNIPTLIEPIVILFFGGVVFIIVSGVLLPLFSIIR
ncbi:MAG: hypothetical protein G01um10142_175 [Parcubacteria group bacterium Gr01-1014_2]|nr:MAG: hypothetical protein G01um10142_175 [Parcubacteria group bacterium Gr01-1014_2]